MPQSIPQVSVIIPAFNSEFTIQTTLESVFQQTFQNFEVILVDDGSQDGTLAIVHQYADPRLTIVSYPNAGPSASRNRGIQRARGTFIACLDADDCWTPDKLEAQLAALKSHPEAALAYSWTDFIDEAGNTICPGSHARWEGQVYERLLIHHFLESGSNSLIRKSVVEEVGGFDETLRAGEDWDLHLKIAARYPFVVVPSVQVFYRQREQSASSNLARLEQDSLTVIKRAFDQAPETLQPLKSQSLSNLYLYLTIKALESIPSRQKGWTALGFLQQAVRWDPGLVRRRSRLLSILLAKSLLQSLLSPQQFHALIHALKTIPRHFF